MKSKIINIPKWLYRLTPKFLIPIIYLPRFVVGFVRTYNEKAGVLRIGDKFTYKYELSVLVTYVKDDKTPDEAKV